MNSLRLNNNLFVGEWIGWYNDQDPGELLDWRDNLLYSVHRFGPYTAPDAALRASRIADLDPSKWPNPAEGPSALKGLPKSFRFNGSSVGPCWITPGRMEPFRELTPLLRSGWLDTVSSLASSPCGPW